MYGVKSLWTKNGAYWLVLSRGEVTLHIASFVEFSSWRMVYTVEREDVYDSEESSKVHYSLERALEAHPDWLETLAGSVFDAALLTPVIQDIVEQAQREAKHPSSVEGRRFPCSHLAPDLLMEVWDE